jgi:hypothetical protein
MAGTYTYSAGVLTVTDGTSGSPANMTDMLAADVAGGWGVVINPYPGIFI